ncbi:MAG: tRNA (N6-threonylcarbamoyladenosine(37)-N6)-methyltransferase TrmO [Clostridia bacterium]|nr:tRNA (N6-threonylcarbamoyladenosine(37)-N6)-methyltransferase TrmO [Clostridia bacterium]
MRPIAHIHTAFPTKFGIPRQSGLISGLSARIVFEPDYRREEALRGLSDYSHLWLLWYFSETDRADWSPTVRPPRLGGNRRMGVFATRSPFRPNPIGLSAVRLIGVEKTPGEGTVLIVEGADLMDGTPVFDIKPYLPYADAIPDAVGGFADDVCARRLRVDVPPELEARVPEALRTALREVLAQDPRPSYQPDGERVYGFPFAGLEVRFTVQRDLLTVCEIRSIP